MWRDVKTTPYFKVPFLVPSSSMGVQEREPQSLRGTVDGGRGTGGSLVIKILLHIRFWVGRRRGRRGIGVLVDGRSEKKPDAVDYQGRPELNSSDSNFLTKYGGFLGTER